MSRRRRDPLADPVRFVDERLGAARPIRFLLDYVFPDHWSFLLGEIALYSFIVLVITGTFLALFFNPDTNQTVYHGAYQPLAGQQSLSGLQLGAGALLHGQGRPADAPDPPLGGARVRRRDHAAPAADHLHRRVPQATRAQLR